MRARQLTDPVAHHAEGPVWSSRWGGLRWVDMLAGDVLSLSADGTIERRRVGEIAAALRPRAGGGAVIGIERGFALEEPDGTLRDLGELWSDASIRMNEGACDPDGRFYCGSMAYDKRPGAGAIYRLDPDGTTRRVLDEVTISNGLDWSPDGSLAYYNDTPTARVTVFDYSREAGLSNPRSLVEVPREDGHPDGLTVDSEGGVWVAMNHAGAVHRYTPGGELDAVVAVPPSQVTACTLGGERLTELFITTSADGLEPGAEPLAGAVFHIDVGVAGQPTREFAG